MSCLPPFQDRSLLTLALTHRSYVNEHPEISEHNERLEFLGDAILAFLVGELLYQRYAEMNEAQLTRLRSNLVEEAQLSRFATELGLGDLLRLGKGAIKDNGRANPALLCDVFEAIIGAYYLDSGLNAVRDYVHELFPPVAERLVASANPSTAFIDPKNRLQQWALERFAQNPQYSIVARSGPDHAGEFTAEVRVNNVLYGTGKGKRKQDATKAAAEDALKNLC
jgi:ribonuclease III